MYTSIHLAGPISAYPNGTRPWHRSPKFSQCTNICISICFGLHYCEAETRISLEIAAVCFSLKYDFVVTSCSSYVCVTLFLSHPKYLHRFFFFFFLVQDACCLQLQTRRSPEAAVIAHWPTSKNRTHASS